MLQMTQTVTKTIQCEIVMKDRKFQMSFQQRTKMFSLIKKSRIPAIFMSR